MSPELEKRLKMVDFPYQFETWERLRPPTQICLHHTASAPGVWGDIEWWKNDRQPVSTPLIVGRDGIGYQIYSSTRWAFSLGLSHPYYRQVEEQTLPVEIDTWGYLTFKNGKFYSWTGAEVPANEVCILDKPHRGQKYFHKYAPEQIEFIRLILIYWRDKYGIPLNYTYETMFNLCNEAIYASKKGLYSHNSFRADKTDIHPQPDMIKMLEGLRTTA